MPSTRNRALLMDLTAFIAENNVRRSILTVATNTLSTGEGILERSLVLTAGSTLTLTAISGNQATVIRTTKPLTCQMTIPNADPITFKITNLFVFTDTVTSLVLTNGESTAEAQIRFLQI